MFLSTFATHPFLVKPIFKSIFSLHQHVFFFQWILFSYFSWQEIWSNIWLEWWGGAPSRPQDPCSIFSRGHQGEFFFGFFVWKNVVSCFIESLMVGHCHFVVCSCWNLGHCMVDHVVMLALEHFLNCCIFGHCVISTMLMAYGILEMLAICDVVRWILSWILGGIGIVKNLCCKLAWTYSWCMWEILLACVIFVSWTCQNFVGMSMDKFVDMENFCGYGTNLWAWDFAYRNIFVGYVMLDHGKIFVVVILDTEFLWLWFWTCRNFLCLFWTWEKNFGCDFDLDMGKIFFGCIRLLEKFFGCNFGHRKKNLDMWFW